MGAVPEEPRKPVSAAADGRWPENTGGVGWVHRLTGEQEKNMVMMKGGLEVVSDRHKKRRRIGVRRLAWWSLCSSGLQRRRWLFGASLQ
jgi:hypothetical protein